MRFSDASRESVTRMRQKGPLKAGFGKIKRMNRSLWLAAAGLLALLPTAPAAARNALVCTVTNRLPDYATLMPSPKDTRVFFITAELVEEHGSGTSAVRQWSVVADRPAQLLAASLPPGNETLTIDRRGNTFVESGINHQLRGYCQPNELP